MTKQEDTPIAKSEVLQLAGDIVSAYISNNAIAVAHLPDLLRATHQQLMDLANEADSKVATKEPAVPIQKSVTDNHIICLEDGAKMKMLKRYIRTRYNLTPDEYRLKWGLPSDYPMVAPAYSKRRSDVAKETGLGKISKN